MADQGEAGQGLKGVPTSRTGAWQMVRYYGHYSNVSRGKRQQEGLDDAIPCILEPQGNEKAFRKSWARLIQGKPSLDYEARVAMVKAAGVAVWDVLLSARRDRSVDAAIIAGSEIPNDLSAFFAMHDQICAVFFNGARAEALFRRFALPGLPQVRSLPLLHLPSTSPANARLTRNDKLEAWRAVTHVLKAV